MNLETITLLHARAVDLCHAGEYSSANKAFRQVLQQLKKLEQFKMNRSEEAVVALPSEHHHTCLQIFPMTDETDHHQGDKSMQLGGPLCVLFKEDRYEDVSSQDIALFVVAALFNMGLNLQLLTQHKCFSKDATTNTAMTAEKVYRIALDVLRSIPNPSTPHHQSTMAFLGAFLCNNLAAHYFESFAHQEGCDVLNGLEFYLQRYDGEPICWLNLNIVLWRDVHWHHAAAA